MRARCPEELLYADDLSWISESPKRLKRKLEALKITMEAKVLRVNDKNTKVMISSEKATKIEKLAEFLDTVCRKVLVAIRSPASFASAGCLRFNKEVVSSPYNKATSGRTFYSHLCYYLSVIYMCLFESDFLIHFW